VINPNEEILASFADVSDKDSHSWHRLEVKQSIAADGDR
jgi:hypothetical protein